MCATAAISVGRARATVSVSYRPSHVRRRRLLADAGSSAAESPRAGTNLPRSHTHTHDDHARGHRGADTRDTAAEKGRGEERGRQRRGPRRIRLLRPGYLQRRWQVRGLRHVHRPQRRVRREYGSGTEFGRRVLIVSSFHPVVSV